MQDKHIPAQVNDDYQKELFFQENKERLVKEKNIIDFKLKDSEKPENNDMEIIKELFSTREIDSEKIKVKRIGQTYVHGKSRPLRVILGSPKHVHWAFHNLELFTNKELYIKNDLTIAQLNYLNIVKNELKSKVEGGITDLTIKNINGLPVIVKKAKKINDVTESKNLSS